MLWCFFYLKGLTVWLCFMVYFGFMCIKHAMIWLQLKDLRWSSPWVCLIWKNLPFIPAEFIFGTICLDLWYCEFSILKIAIFVMSDVYLLCLFLQVWNFRLLRQVLCLLWCYFGQTVNYFIVWYVFMCWAWLFKSLKFGNGSTMSDEKPVVLEVKYLHNKKMIETWCEKYFNKEEL